MPELFQSKIGVGQALSVSLTPCRANRIRSRLRSEPQLDTAGRAVVLGTRWTIGGGVLKPGMLPACG